MWTRGFTQTKCLPRPFSILVKYLWGDGKTVDTEIKIPSSEFLQLSKVRLVMLRLWMFCLLTGILQFRLLPSRFFQLHFLLLSSLETQSDDLVPNMSADIRGH